MITKPVGAISNRLGLYEVRIRQVRRIVRRSYLTVECSLCDKPHGQRWWNGQAAWRYAQAHADWHQDQINTALNIPLPHSKGRR